MRQIKRVYVSLTTEGKPIVVTDVDWRIMTRCDVIEILGPSRITRSEQGDTRRPQVALMTEAPVECDGNLIP